MHLFYVITAKNTALYDKYVIEQQVLGICYVCDVKKQRFIRIKLDAAFHHYLLKELKLSEIYRLAFVRNFIANYSYKHGLIVVLESSKTNLIDYRWNDIVYWLAREKCELDHALSWLSTLGGAFSALGDYFDTHAEIAGKISYNQFKLALRLGDPNVASRCRLYLSLSLIQRKQYHLAKKSIRQEFELVKSAPVVDIRLIKMCKGIWSKLQYEYLNYRNEKKKCIA